MGPAPRPRHRPGHPDAVRRPAESRNRLAVSGAAPAGEARLAEGRMGRQPGQSAREILQAHGGGQEAAAARGIALGAARERHRPDHEAGAGYRGVTLAMRPDERELDDEIRAHLAISVRERIEAGEDPEAARLAALRELGYLPAIRESMRQVWYSRWIDAAAALGRDLRIALRSLRRAKGLAATVVVTLALGIGANAAIFSVVRGVLLRPLVNRDEDRLIYIRQSAPGIGVDNITFSVPEVADLKARVTSIADFGDFSTVGFTVVGLTPEPRVVRAGVVGGSFFEVMGLRPVLGRLLNPQDDGPNAAGAAVLTHRFWTTALESDPAVIGTTIRLGDRSARIIGVLEPSVPYPAETEIIANVVTSPHHLDATMVDGRVHRMTELFGRLAPGATLDAARAELATVHATIVKDHPE